MSVYVDGQRAAYGRMRMCHMLADSEHELDAMADVIGVARKWRQTSRCGVPHYDICLAKRRLAIEHGAVEVTRQQVVELLRRCRAQGVE